MYRIHQAVEESSSAREHQNSPAIGLIFDGLSVVQISVPVDEWLFTAHTALYRAHASICGSFKIEDN